MLRQFILNFSTGLMPHDGKGVCFSFNQDLHDWDLEAFVAYIMNYKLIISELWVCQKVLTHFKELDSAWLFFFFFSIHFDPLRIFYIELKSPIHLKKFGALDLCEHTGPPVNGGYTFLLSCILLFCIWVKMYERHKRRYSLCDISKVDRTVDVVLLKVRGGNTSCIMKLSRLFSLCPVVVSLDFHIGKNAEKACANRER